MTSRAQWWLSAWLVVALAPTADSANANWPGWRGDGSGVCREEKTPLYWSADAGIDWKTPLPGAGNSSPVVWGERVFLTAATDAGTNRLVLCFDRNDGHELWRTNLPATRLQETYVKNGYASPTPVTDGERVYAFFDSPGLAALDMDGKLLWTRDLGPFKNSYNMASSPVLCGDVVIQCCDQDEGSFIVAFDKATGAERWRTPRPGMSRQFATPLLVNVAGATQVVVNGETVIAYDPATGKPIWSCRGMRPNVTPSAVAAEGLVYAVSGRNGPALAINPHGTGDVTETHARLLTASGGPYVPSPLALPAGLLLPGDDGRTRLISSTGAILCDVRIPGHYTASPTAAGDVIYWPNEKGDVTVVRIEGATNAPRLNIVAVNSAGGACLASAALVGGKIFLRTDKALLCISGAAKPGGAAPTDLPATLEALALLFKAHPAAEGPDVALRIAIVEKLGAMKEVESVPLLRDAALKDPHWDVGEAAAKSLAGIGQPAAAALIALLAAPEWQPYLKTIAAEALGQLAIAEAVPPLLNAARSRNVLVRVPVVQALGRIAAANPAETDKVLPALTTGLADPEGTVRKAAVEALARNAGAVAPGATRDALARKLDDATRDRNPLVAQAAVAAQAAFTQAPPPSRKASAMRWLRAGPVRMKFADGELRYLRVGRREIIRRVYFAVRDERYDTVRPDFNKIEVDAAEDAFTIRLAAVCSNDVAGFSWTGTITGGADGRISFQVNGQAERDFKPPRIGLNVLYGTEALGGQAYELVGEDGAVTTGEFPRRVAVQLLSQSFRALRYTTTSGLQVSVGLAAGSFGMEDQRNFGDSSYKAFSGMAFKPMAVRKGETGAQTLTIDVRGATADASAADTALRVTLGGALAGAALPKVLPSLAGGKGFGEINRNSAQHAAATELTWGFNVASHLPDNDTFMENIPAVADQVAAVRAFAPQAKIRVAPVTFNSPYPRPGADPRLQEPFSAAWGVRMMKQLACAGVAEAAFEVGTGPAASALQELAKLEGHTLLATVFEGGGIPPAADVLAVDADGARQIWLVNLTEQPASVTLAGLGEGATVRGERDVKANGGELALELAPFEVRRLSVKK